VPAYEIVSVGYRRGEENAAHLWGDSDWNARSQHIVLKLASVPTNSTEFHEYKHTADLHIFTYEKHSKVMYHLSNMWMNCFTRIKANVAVEKEVSGGGGMTLSIRTVTLTPRARAQVSELKHASSFYHEVNDIMHELPVVPHDEQIQVLSYFASEIGESYLHFTNLRVGLRSPPPTVNDLTLKRVFFVHGSLCLFCIKCISDFMQEMEDSTGDRDFCLLLLRRVVVCFKVLSAALFNSQMVTER
jgi:hypothetical protein